MKKFEKKNTHMRTNCRETQRAFKQGKGSFSYLTSGKYNCDKVDIIPMIKV